ncbi:MAG: porin [Rhodobacteraceae bacterium]|nr:porin [Paracoccaceae bacterium]
MKFAESDDDSKSELQFHHEFKVTFAASGTTDGGIGFGGKMTLDNTESVTSGKVTPAKTGYIVTQADLTESGKKALEAKYGLTETQVNALSLHDVIESGMATNFSGFGEATVAGHTYTELGPYTPGSEIAYTRKRTIATAVRGTTPVADAFQAGDVLTIGPDPDGAGAQAIPTLTVVANSETPKTGQITVDEANYQCVLFAGGGINAAPAGTIRYEDPVVRTVVTAIRGTDAVAPGVDFADGDVLTIGSDDDGEAVTITVGTGAGLIEADAADATYAVLSSSVNSTTHTRSLSGEPKLAVSQVYIDSLSASVAASDSQSVNNHGEVYISMDMHKLTIGSDLDAADKLAGGLADPGFDGIGIDDVAEGPYGGSAADVRYDGDFGVASVAISYGDNAGDAAWAAGFSFNVEPVTFGAGFDSNGVMSVGMGFTQGAIAMNALYSTDSDHDEADNEAFKCEDVAPGKAGYNAAKHTACAAKLISDSSWSNKPDLKNQAFGVDVSYQMNEATSVVLVAAQHKKESAHISYNRGTPVDNTTTPATPATPASYSWSTSSTTVDAFGVGFSHDLGGGATLKAGAGSVDSNAVADLGITMKF